MITYYDAYVSAFDTIDINIDIDKKSYTVKTWFNIATCRYYITIASNQARQIVLSVPLINSDNVNKFNLVAGYFSNKLFYNVSSLKFEVISE